MDIFTNILDSNHLVQNILRSMSSYSSVNDRSFNGRTSSTGFAFTTKFSIVSFEHRISHDFFFLSLFLSFVSWLQFVASILCPISLVHRFFRANQKIIRGRHLFWKYYNNIIEFFLILKIQLPIFSIYNWRIVIYFLKILCK